MQLIIKQAKLVLLTTFITYEEDILNNEQTNLRQRKSK